MPLVSDGTCWHSDLVGLPVFDTGATITAVERWHGLLWSAVPSRVIRSTPTQLVSYVPAGTVGTYATNRGLPETAGLDRDQRKLLAMKTCNAVVAERPETPDKLNIYRLDRWARVNLGWDAATGAFLGWYVNFELPPVATPTGLASKDLVLDMWVDPDRKWRWKDADDFRCALHDHILDPGVEAPIHAEAEVLLDEISSGTGPFGDDWIDFHADPDWNRPQLSGGYIWGGSEWTLPAGDRLPR